MSTSLYGRFAEDGTIQLVVPAGHCLYPDLVAFVAQQKASEPPGPEEPSPFAVAMSAAGGEKHHRAPKGYTHDNPLVSLPRFLLR